MEKHVTALYACTCCEPVSLLTPLRDEHGDLPVAPPPKGLHSERYSSTGEEPVKTVPAETGTKRRGTQ